MSGLNEDFVDLLESFLAHEVEFVVVGAHALAARWRHATWCEVNCTDVASPKNVDVKDLRPPAVPA